MHLLTLLVTFCTLVVAYPGEQQAIVDNVGTASTLRDSLLGSAIIPEVLDDFEPSFYLDITFPKHHDKVLLGNNVTVKHAKKRPTFTFHELETSSPPIVHSDTIYTLVLTDPDAISRDNPKWSEMCHWIMTNLTAPISIDLLDSASKSIPGELVEYKAPGPPPKTGAHRYVFVLLTGNSMHVQAPSERKHWGYGKPRHGVRDWAYDNNLTVVGANYFYSKNKKQ